MLSLWKFLKDKLEEALKFAQMRKIFKLDG